MNKIIIPFIAFITISLCNAQVLKKTNNNKIQLENNQNKFNNLIVFSNEKTYNLNDESLFFKEVFDAPPGITFKKTENELDNLGFEHTKFQQYFNNVKIEFATFKIHSQNKKIKSLSSNYFQIDSSFNTAPSINNSTAFSKAVNHTNAQQYLWDIPDVAAKMDNYKKPEGKLVILPIFDDNLTNQNPNLKLAYKFDIYATKPASRGNLYIDANNGDVLFYDAIIKHVENFGHVGNTITSVETEGKYCSNLDNMDNYYMATGTAATRYSGSKDVTTRVISGSYRLRDNTRGNGINTYNSGQSPSYSNTNFSDANNNWTAAEFDNALKDNAALDAHWGAEMTYDYWLTTHSRNSYNNSGAAINSYVHYDDVAGGLGYDNAFWNGSVMTYGDGSSNGNEGNGFFDALTSLDVAAHEIGHAITSHTANLAYQRESGALNEGFSDIWGAAVEHYAKGTGTDTNPDNNVWLIGEEIDRRNGSVALRSMNNPNERGQPDTYGGSYWIDPNCGTPTNANDYCGVHTNSGVLNYWFYLLTEGGNGTNDVGTTYNVGSIGINKAANIAYRTLNYYLGSNSTFANARTFSIQAATDLYGPCSLETQSVTNAWSAVNVGDPFVNSCVPSIGFLSVTNNTNEATDCSYQDITIPLYIGIAPSQTATVNFSVNGGTATNNLDYEIVTPTISFPSGSNENRNLTLRVFNDGFVESNETIIIDFTVNANGGNAQADATADTLTFTIIDDNLTPTPNYEVLLLTEDFEASAWNSLDADGDNNDWLGLQGLTYTGITGAFPGSETNLEPLGGTGKANANNYLISPLITIPENTVNTEFIFGVGGYLTQEHYAVYWTQNATNVANINSGIKIEERNTLANNGELRSLNLTNIAGESGYFVIRHFNSNSNDGIILFDNVSITATVERQIQTAINNGITNDEISLNSSGTIYSSDASSDNLMLSVTNNNSFDYGCLNISVLSEGTSGKSYNGSIAPNLIMDKSFNISTTNDTSSGDATLTFYFSESEISGWESATGLSRNDLMVLRNDESTENTESSNVIVDSFGNFVTLTGSFTNITGVFSFGNEKSISCTNTKTFTGNWDSLPNEKSHLIFSTDYSTNLNGNIDACSCKVSENTTLVVNAGNYIKLEHDIIVDGSLIVEHTANVVQDNKDAKVVKNSNAVINVALTTPALNARDIIILGSPMDSETKTVFNNAYGVFEHNTEDFDPYNGTPAVNGVNFLDNDFNDFQIQTGVLNPAEGYYVKPSHTEDGTYNYNFTNGTLNSGNITYNAYFGDDKQDSPNIISNPYASAIDASQFIDDNPIVSEIYFWEHNTTPNNTIPGPEAANYNMQDVSVYNGTMGTPAASGGTTPNGVIATGQGFAIKANNGGLVTFTNDMRLTSGNTTLRTTDNRDLLWLKVENEVYGLSSTAGLGFLDQATDGIDNKYDSNKLGTVVSLYSHLQDGSEQFSIQGLSTFDESLEIPFGFSTLVDNDNHEYIISLANFEGSNIENAIVYLRDNFTQITTNLNQSNYRFNAVTGDYDNRFTLLFSPLLGGADNIKLEENVVIHPNPSSSIITVDSFKSEIINTEFYDLRGRNIINTISKEYNKHLLDISSLVTGVYYLTINTVDGSVTKKIIKM